MVLHLPSCCLSPGADGSEKHWDWLFPAFSHGGPHTASSHGSIHDKQKRSTRRHSHRLTRLQMGAANIGRASGRCKFLCRRRHSALGTAQEQILTSGRRPLPANQYFQRLFSAAIQSSGSFTALVPVFPWFLYSFRSSDCGAGIARGQRHFGIER